MVMKLNLKKNVVKEEVDKLSHKRTFHRLNSILQKKYNNQKTKHYKLIIKKHFMESLTKISLEGAKQKLMKKFEKIISLIMVEQMNWHNIMIKVFIERLEIFKKSLMKRKELKLQLINRSLLLISWPKKIGLSLKTILTVMFLILEEILENFQEQLKLQKA